MSCAKKIKPHLVAKADLVAWILKAKEKAQGVRSFPIHSCGNWPARQMQTMSAWDQRKRVM